MIRADTNGISIEDIAAIQGDNLSLSSQEIIPYLESLALDDPALASARDSLVGWDGQMSMDSPEAALFANVLFQLSQATFNDQLPESLWPIGGTRTQDALFHLLQQPDNTWWDDATTLDVIETRDDILLKAFTKGYEASVAAMGDNMDAWKWGDIHTATFANATFGKSGISLIESIFNRGPFAVSGGTGMVNATNWSGDEGDPFAVSSLPSMRQIVDLSDLSATLMIHTTGESGHPGNPHYDDFIDPWRLIQYHPALWDRPAIENDSKGHLTLVPPG